MFPYWVICLTSLDLNKNANTPTAVLIWLMYIFTTFSLLCTHLHFTFFYYQLPVGISAHVLKGVSHVILHHVLHLCVTGTGIDHFSIWGHEQKHDTLWKIQQRRGNRNTAQINCLHWSTTQQHKQQNTEHRLFRLVIQYPFMRTGCSTPWDNASSCCKNCNVGKWQRNGLTRLISQQHFNEC